jgi:transposase
VRGADYQTAAMFSYISPEGLVPQNHPLRAIRPLVNAALQRLSPQFDKIYAPGGRDSIAPERLLRALLLQALFSVRSERQLMEQITYNMMFRWFVGLSMDAPVWDVTVFTKIASVCCRVTSRAAFWPRSWWTPRSSRCCRTSISR